MRHTGNDRFAAQTLDCLAQLLPSKRVFPSVCQMAMQRINDSTAWLSLPRRSEGLHAALFSLLSLALSSLPSPPRQPAAAQSGVHVAGGDGAGVLRADGDESGAAGSDCTARHVCVFFVFVRVRACRDVLVLFCVLRVLMAFVLHSRFFSPRRLTRLIGMRDPDPGVRGAAVICLGQFADHLRPDILQYRDIIVPLLFAALDETSEFIVLRALRCVRSSVWSFS